MADDFTRHSPDPGALDWDVGLSDDEVELLSRDGLAVEEPVRCIDSDDVGSVEM